jgi:hypothetical protein
MDRCTEALIPKPLRSERGVRPILCHLESMREIYAPNLRNGTIAVTLQEFRYLTTEHHVIE